MKIPINYLSSERIKPRDFLRHLLIGRDCSEIDYLEAETTICYRTQAIKVLSRLLSVNPTTVRNHWGKTLNFESMPENYQLVLAYVETAGINQKYASPIIKEKYTPARLTAKDFLDYALGLDKLTTEEIKLRLSNNSFFTECAHTLSQVLGFGYRTVMNWGYDIRFHKMPQEYEYFLYYALEAIKTRQALYNKDMIVAACR